MNPDASTYRFATSPRQRHLTISSSSQLTLDEVIRFMSEKNGAQLSSDLISAKKNLQGQWEDPKLRETSLGGRDPQISTFVLSRDELTQMSKIPRELWLRYIAYRYKFKIYPRRRILNDFPIVALIEPTSICNLKCQMCFQSDPSFSQHREFLGKMDFSLYQKIIDEMVQHRCDSLVLASRGEPTLHPRFADMVEYATSRILDVKINTNATRLDEALCHRLLQTNTPVVVFSIDSADPKQYEEIRKGAKFDQVLTNIQRFRDIRQNHYPNCRTVTRVSGTLFRDDQDPERIRTFWSEFVDQVALHTAWPFWDSYNAPLSQSTQPCGVLWERMYIWWDGVCNPCDIDYKSLLSFGKVDEQNSLQQIWLSPRAQQIRSAHQNVQKNSCIPCNRCSGTV